MTDTTTAAMIINGRLALAQVNEGGIQSFCAIGVRQFRAGICQIEASTRPLTDRTRARLAVLRDGVAIWEARAK